MILFNYFPYNYGILGVIIVILIWLIIIGVVIEVIRAIVGPHPRSHQPLPPVPPAPVVPVATIHTTSGAVKTPLEILNERYAKGEINKDEYDQKKLDITRAHNY